MIRRPLTQAANHSTMQENSQDGVRKMTLNEMKIGSTAVIRQVGGEGPLRCRLLDMGLIPGTKVTLQKVAPMGDPIEIRVRGYELTLRVEDGQKIQVEEVKA